MSPEPGCAPDTLSYNYVVKPGVFISYRRDTGSHLAGRISDYLEESGFDPFLDVDGLRSGHFDHQILEEISRREHFVLVCTKDALVRCAIDGDWVRLEIAHAIRTKRNIVPVVDSGFLWPKRQDLPSDISEICIHHAFEYSHTHWRATRGKLLERLVDSAKSAKIAVRAMAVNESEPVDLSDRGGAESVAAQIEDQVQLQRAYSSRSRHPQARHGLAKALHQLAEARLVGSDRDLDLAIAAGTESLGIRRQIVAARVLGHEAMVELGESLWQVGRIEQERGSIGIANERFIEYLESQRAAAKLLKGSAGLAHLAMALFLFAGVPRASGDLDRALAALDERLGILRLLDDATRSPSSRWNLSEGLKDVADVEFALKYVDRPLKRLSESTEILRRLAQDMDTPERLQRLSAGLRQMSEVERARGRHESALRYGHEALDAARELVARPDAVDSSFTLGQALGAFVEAQLESGDAAKADAASEEALAVWGARVQRKPLEAIDVQGTARAIAARGRVFQAAGNREQGARLFELATRLDITAAQMFESSVMKAVAARGAGSGRQEDEVRRRELEIHEEMEIHEREIRDVVSFLMREVR